jgi:DNA-directed RNA polymerase subunit beta
MQLSFTEKKNIRKSFGKLKESLSIPNLIEVQKNSYKELTEFHSEAELQKVLTEFLKVYFQLKI